VILSDHFLLVFGSLRANLRRAALAMIGLTCGVAALLGLVSLGQLTRTQVVGSLTQMGTATVIRVEILDVAGKGLYSHQFSPDQAVRLVRTTLGLTAASVEASAWRIQLDGPAGTVFSHVIGVQPEYGAVMGLKLEAGRFIGQRDLDEAAPLAVIGSELAQELFGRDPPAAGAKVTIKGETYVIVGRLRPTPWEPGNLSLFVPLTTAQRRLSQARYAQLLRARAADLDRMEETVRAVTRFFKRHSPVFDQLEISYNKAAVKSIRGSITTLKVFLGAVGLLTLILGGLGLMNTILASLAERTREIGLRRAVGATVGDIFWQFLAEAASLSLLGSLAGVALGWIMLRLAGQLMHLDPGSLSLDPLLAVAAAGLTTLVGLGFSLSPVLKAARLDAIQALRYY